MACGSRDAQTLALSDEGMVFSWGDGDFGKLGRGGSEGCDVPHNVERLNPLGVIQIECGAQFSLALTKCGEVKKTDFKKPIVTHICMYEAYIPVTFKLFESEVMCAIIARNPI